MNDDSLIPRHGGYRSLKSFQVAQLCYDVTVQFCERYINKRSRTHDQMVQAARSGVQNIAEGSQCSGTSKKFELKLTSVARASLEELLLDYEDYLRHRGLPQWPPNHPALLRFKKRRCATLEEVRAWVADERARGPESGNRPASGLSVPVRGRPCPSSPGERLPQNTDNHGPARTGTDGQGPEADSAAAPGSATLAANGALSLLNLACHLLDRQIAAQAAAFEKEGGFTERLYRIRSERRRHPPKP